MTHPPRRLPPVDVDAPRDAGAPPPSRPDRRRTRVAGRLLVGALVLAGAGVVTAQTGRQVKVLIEFRHSGREAQETVQGGGRIVVTPRSGPRGAGRLDAESAETRVRRSTGVFTLVQDGGESTLTVATQVPYPQAVFLQDYATGAGHVATGVAFRDVGTSLTVRASILPGNQVRVRLTPTISYASAAGPGVVELAEASTELVVPSGRPVVLGGATTQTHAVTRRILGLAERQAASETTVVLTVTIQ
jgi:hypothetical protein